MPRILLVKDDAINVKNTVEFLELQGYDVIVTDDGEQAIQMALDHVPNLIMMDASLDTGSAIDGWEASRRLKAEARTQSIPIIAVTASASASDKQIAVNAGCDGFLEKPFKFKDLIAKIENLIRD